MFGPMFRHSVCSGSCDLMNGETSSTENRVLTDSGTLTTLFQRLSTMGPSLSKFQAVVGLITGLLSIGGAILAIPQFFSPMRAPAMGEVVAVVQEAKSHKAITDARIEILTPQNVLVTTVTPNYYGKARHALDEGLYRIRASHPRYAAEVRQVHIVKGQSAEVYLDLRAGSPSAIDHAERAVRDGVGAVKRIFGQ
ncbi:MAG TPA: hypothetical protein VGL09_16790 [Methylomirabilota bacterium]